MKITRLTTIREGNVDRVLSKELFDTDKLIDRAKNIPERIENINETIDNTLDKVSIRICDFIG